MELKKRNPPSGVLDFLGAEDARLYERIPDKVSFVPHPSFSRKAAQSRLFGAGSEVDVPPWINYAVAPGRTPPGSPRRAVLNHEEEGRLFLRLNYARYRLSRLLRAQRQRRTKARARQMVRWFRRSLAARADLVRANMALVLAMAKRTRVSNVEFGELVSEGNLALLRSVERFDVSRGFRFSTYACRAILKSFSRTAIRTSRYRQHFPTAYDPELERGDHDALRHEIQWQDSLDALGEILAHNRARLSKVEQKIVTERFAIRPHSRRQALAEVGKMVGLSKERVRQIQNHALGKIRVALD